MILDPDRLFSPEPRQRAIARELYDQIVDLPLLSPHGHTDPRWFADNEPFDDPTSLLVTPDHYLTRMLYSQGVPLESLGVAPRRRRVGEPVDPAPPRASGGRSPTHYHLFRGTPSGLWMNHVLHEVFGVDDPPHRRDRRRHLRPDRRLPRRRPSSGRGPARPVPHRRRRHHRLAAQQPRASSAPRATTVSPAGSSRRSDPTPSSIPTTNASSRTSPHLGELTGRDTTQWDEYLAALFERRQLAMLARRHRDRPRAADRIHRVARPRRRRSDCSTRALAGTLDDGRQGDSFADRSSSRWQR